ncbi:hypothetical protein PilKf_00158 [Pillotina sp. SPG140]
MLIDTKIFIDYTLIYPPPPPRTLAKLSHSSLKHIFTDIQYFSVILFCYTKQNYGI